MYTFGSSLCWVEKTENAVWYDRRGPFENNDEVY